MSERFDFLVIGGGIAGLTYALKAARHGSVALLFKKDSSQSATSWAQGGIAAVSSDQEEDYKSHIADTLRCGAGLCHDDIVSLVVREGPARLKELIEVGASFDRDENGRGYHLHQEGGHSQRRIYHAADATGAEIQRALLKAADQNINISFFNFANAVDLLTTHKLNMELGRPNRVFGAYVLTADGKVKTFLADKILMATGGAGKVYLYTSNPDVATGDGIAMCYRAGARVANMEFFQFHPTCLYHPKAKSFLITEAMRGEGAILRTINGEAFMGRYHKDAELAPRDVVARAIDYEMKANGFEYVLLDITHREASFITSHFPGIYQKCLSFGYDITREPIPVVPAAHYSCGGVVTDHNGLSDLKDLYLAGECAFTGLHGANRLASNSLLEALVFASRAAEHSIENLNKSPLKITPPEWDSGTASESDEEVVILQNWDEIRRFMWNYVGIVRSDKRLARALRRSELIEKEINDYYWNFKVTSDLLELRNLSLVANLVIRSAIFRKESRGLHFNIDYPESRSDFSSDTIL